MIKCEMGMFNCKASDENELLAEFEVIFVNIFNILINEMGLVKASEAYNMIFKSFGNALDQYSKHPKDNFVDLYMEVIIKDNKKMLKDMINDDSFIKDIVDLYNKYKGVNDD